MRRPILRRPRRTSRAIAGLSFAALTLLSACGGSDGSGGGLGGGDDVNAPPSRAFGIWNPGPNDTCTKDQHDAYATVGPDGKRYPTWHPPTGPGGCTFGHEHGRDPSGSNLYAKVGPIPFGYANEALATFDPQNVRDEDHFGHKVEWQNDVTISKGGILEAHCDVLTKLHQGTHSKDAFSNNVHELVYAVRCSDGTDLHATLLTAIGKPGEFKRGCDRDVTITVGPAVPANSPTGGGFRAIADRFCVEQHMLVAAGQTSDFDAALHENWETSSSIRAKEGNRELASFNPYFQVSTPSRFYDATKPNVTGRPIDICYEAGANGTSGRGGLCAESTDSGRVAGVTFDDPRSKFNGADHFMDLNQTNMSNDGGPEIWYTDPYGRNGQTTEFPGSVRQRIKAITNSVGGLDGPQIGRNRTYAGVGTRAPN